MLEREAMQNLFPIPHDNSRGYDIIFFFLTLDREDIFLIFFSHDKTWGYIINLFFLTLKHEAILFFFLFPHAKA
jgi:hypothetical protein